MRERGKSGDVKGLYGFASSAVRGCDIGQYVFAAHLTFSSSVALQQPMDGQDAFPSGAQDADLWWRVELLGSGQYKKVYPGR